MYDLEDKSLTSLKIRTASEKNEFIPSTAPSAILPFSNSNLFKTKKQKKGEEIKGNQYGPEELSVNCFGTFR